VVYLNSATAPATYSASDPNKLAAASFEVTANAMPDLPTPLSALLAALGAALTYGIMRQRARVAV
jgi:hypothetical protein